MSDSYVVEDTDGTLVADIRDADEMTGLIELFPGWVVIQKMKLSRKTREGIILPSDEAKQEHNLILFRVAIVGSPKQIEPEKTRPIPFKVGDVVILKPMLAQMILNQGQEFGIVADTDVIGKMKVRRRAKK